MAKISTYNLDSSLNDNDKLIGTDGGTGLTKNFSVRTFINYINQQGNVNIVSSVNGLDGDVVLNTDDIPEGANKYDQEVTITGSEGATVTGVYPNFNVSSKNDTYTAGNNITINNDNVISSSYMHNVEGQRYYRMMVYANTGNGSTWNLEYRSAGAIGGSNTFDDNSSTFFWGIRIY